MSSRSRARLGAALALGLSIAAAASFATADPPRLTLRFEPQVTLELVARRMGITLRPEVPLPRIRLESATPIERFRDAVESQWGTRPKRFSNAYVVATNEIYLIDAADFYRASGRTLDDSLAHELTHYLQAHYVGADVAGDFQELDAVRIQNWFRTEQMRTRLVDVDG